jgi:antitoxin (DNA-binding transcriptional repressor) of toxin-antitoxin stability system
MERAAAGEELLVTHRGRPRIRVAPALPRLFPAATAAPA